jgi:phage host-nuclease inhibitor protein Gam
MARPKKAAIALTSISECTRAMGELLVALTDLEALTAERDMAVAAASQKFEGIMDDAKTRRDELQAALREYYMAHVDELEKEGRRSIQLVNGTMGRRMAPPKLALLNRSWTWAAVMVRLREKYGARFLRLRDPEIDKDLVKAELAIEELKALGVRIDQDETFYAEPARMPAEGK